MPRWKGAELLPRDLVTVVCVLRSGGDFTPEYVERLKNGIDANLSGHRFVCLSDCDVPCERVPLVTDWPGWWAKVELFRLTGKILYFDLDTIITGSLQEIADYPHKFTMLRDVGRYSRSASGMLAWQGNYSRLYDSFSSDLIPKYMDHARGAAGGPWGDGGYISDHVEHEIFQDLFPGQIVSYKWQRKTERQGARVVCYHGPPRPHETGWAA